MGKYPAGASPYGALDMAGNVWEWVADRYDAAYYLGSPAENPTVPSSGEDRVLRGGSSYHSKGNMRTAARLKLGPAPGLNYIGFRCSRSP